MANEQIRTVLFDIDNTLYSFTKANKAALDALRSYCREQFGWDEEEFDERHDAVQEEIYTYLGYTSSCRSRILRYQKMMEQSGLPLYPHAARMYDLYWDTLLEVITPFEGAAAVMRELKERGLRIGVCTDMTAYMQFRKLEKLGLLSYVDFLVSSEEAGEEKPSPAMFRMCAKKALCLPEHCLMVGDNLRKDIRGALSFGMQAVWFRGESSSKVEGLRADQATDVPVITRLEQVMDYC